MNRQPIQPFLKVTAILDIIQSVLYLILAAFTVVCVLNPELLRGSGVTVSITAGDPMDMIEVGVSAVCYVISIALAVKALKHKDMNMISRWSSTILMFLVVFSVIDMESFTDFGAYLGILVGALIPALFCIAAYKQNQIDSGIK